MKVGVVVGVFLVIAALVICFAPLIDVAYPVTVEYKDTETYYEDEPYQEVETYPKQQPLNYEVVKAYVKEVKGTERSSITIGTHIIEETEETTYLDVVCVDVKNTDTVEGMFEVSFSVAKPTFGSLSLKTTLELRPGQIKTAQCPADQVGDWNYWITPSTKEIEDERTVTKYKQVEKQRTVTNQRQETRLKRVTVLDYLLSPS